MTYTSESDPGQAQNNRDRGQRRAASRKQQRCDQARAELRNPMGPLLGLIGELTPEEMWIFQHGPAHKIRAVVRKMDYLMEILSGVPPTLPVVPDDKLKDVPQPTRVLQPRHCGRSPVPFAGPPIVLPEPIPMWGRMVYLRRDDVDKVIRASPCRFRVFQILNTLLGPDLEHVARIAATSRFVHPPFTPAEIEQARRMLDYPGPYDQAREAYAAMVNAYRIPVARGDWGASLAKDLERLRPGIQIPKRLQRDHYLVRMVDVRGDEPQCLDFYSLEYRPLCRAPLNPGQ